MCETEAAARVHLLRDGNSEMISQADSTNGSAEEAVSGENLVDRCNVGNGAVGANNGMSVIKNVNNHTCSKNVTESPLKPAKCKRTRVTGTLRCYSARLGYGFVLSDVTGENYLIPACNIDSDTSDLDLSAEWPVEFEVVDGPRGSEAGHLIMLSSWPDIPATEEGAESEEKAVSSKEEPTEENRDEEPVFEYDNVQVNESSPEPLLVEELPPVEQAPGGKKKGKQLAVECRVKWFTRKLWQGEIVRDGDADNEAVFIRLSTDAVEAVLKRGIANIGSGQRVCVDIDWSTQEWGPTDHPDAIKPPPFLCTDLRLAESNNTKNGTGDLRASLTTTKTKPANGIPAKPAQNQKETTKNLPKSSKKRRNGKSQEGPYVKRPLLGNKSFGGGSRPPAAPYGSNRGAVMQPPRYPQHAMSYGGGGGGYQQPQQQMSMGSAVVSSVPYGMHHSRESRQLPPQLMSGSYGGGAQSSFYNLGRASSSRVPGMGQRSVTMPALLERQGPPQQPSGRPGGDPNALMNLYENAMSYASRLNPYQAAEQQSATSNRYAGSSMSSSQRYFEQQSRAPPYGSAPGGPVRRY